MGLDWNPLNRPIPGYEEEFEKLLDRLVANEGDVEANLARFRAISTPALETIDPPRVGFSQDADRWAEEAYRRNKPDVTLSEWLAQLRGFAVVRLLPPCPGIPVYSNGSAGGYVEPTSFRAQFLCDCEAIIGGALLDAAYRSKTAEAAARYGATLRQKAESFASATGTPIPTDLPEDVDSIESQLHIVKSAADWCAWWSARGHGIDAYW